MDWKEKFQNTYPKSSKGALYSCFWSLPVFFFYINFLLSFLPLQEKRAKTH